MCEPLSLLVRIDFYHEVFGTVSAFSSTRKFDELVLDNYNMEVNILVRSISS